MGSAPSVWFSFPSPTLPSLLPYAIAIDLGVLATVPDTQKVFSKTSPNHFLVCYHLGHCDRAHGLGRMVGRQGQFCWGESETSQRDDLQAGSRRGEEWAVKEGERVMQAKVTA